MEPSGNRALIGDVAVLTIDSEGVVTGGGGPALAPLEVEVEASIGRRYDEAFAERPRLAAMVRAALEGRSGREELRLDHRHLVLRFEPGHGGGALVMAADVTVETRAEREIATVARYLRRFFSTFPVALWVTDRELRITFAHGDFDLLSPEQAKRVIGMRVQDFVRSEDPSVPGLAHHLAALKGEPQSYCYIVRGHSFDVVVDPLRDDRGRIIGCVGAAVDVSERLEMKEALQTEQQRLKEAQELAHVGSFEWDISSDKLRWSDEMHRIFGLEPGQFEGTFDAYLARCHPADVDEASAVLFEALRTGEPFDCRHRVVRADGSVRMLRSRGAAISDAADRPTRIVGSCWDVTEITEATERLKDTVALLRSTLNATADGLLVVESDGRVSTYNERFCELWGIPKELAETKDDERLMRFVLDQLRDPEEFVRNVRGLYDTPEAESFDMLHFKDGRIFERYSTPKRVGGVTSGRVWSFRDVTEKEQLLQRTQFLADATRLLNSLDLEPALESVAHLAVPELGVACVIDLLGDSQPRRLLATARDDAATVLPDIHGSVLAGYPTIFRHGAVCHAAAPLFVKGEVAGAVTFVAAPGKEYSTRDLELVEELARRIELTVENTLLYRDAREALNMRDEFLSIAAHEIRGPITSMTLAAEGLQQERFSRESIAHVLDIIHREAKRLASFVDELFDLSRIRSGRLAFDLSPVPLPAVVRSAIQGMSAEIARSGSALTVTTKQHPVGTWDRLRLEQVVTNLLSNAVRFGRGKPIEIVVDRRDNRALLTVRDHGVGIAKDALERIFRPFERGPALRHLGGLGIGLHIVRTIVEGHGGTVRAESVLGEGATFTVELPLGPEP